MNALIAPATRSEKPNRSTDGVLIPTADGSGVHGFSLAASASGLRTGCAGSRVWLRSTRPRRLPPST